MFDKISEELKQARENASLTIQQVASKTRIDIKFIENIESGNFSFMPELYIKAFIRDFSKIVGLDENIMMKKFDAAKKGLPLENIVTTENEPAKPNVVEKKGKDLAFTAPLYSNVDDAAIQRENAINYKKKMIIASSIAGISVLFIIVYFVFFGSNSEIIVSEKPIGDIIRENQSQYNLNKTSNSAGDSSNVTSKSDSLSLLITSKDTSWIKIILDGSNESSFTIFPYSKKSIKAKYNYQLTVGNSAAISLLLNNKLLNFSGKKNMVQQVFIDSTGMKYMNPIQKSDHK